MPDYYFFFDADDMPLAVFYTCSKGEAFDLFARLYRRVWSESVKLGITMMKESDVPAERWDEIHGKYIAKLEPIVPVIEPVVIKLSEHRKQYKNPGLTTEKYISKI